MNNTRILAVDDEPGVLKFITENLRHYNLTTEISAMKALEIIQNEVFDIFIVDYQMPLVNGIELLEEIKRIYLGKHYMSILCTAYGTIHLFKAELVEGLYEFYLEKPIAGAMSK
ncbi:MAG: response regulator [Spirochaetales bacterium]|nr:response regulator [Spirochaetales bacterium]